MPDEIAKCAGVGYKRPPKAHQFKKGRSGNPKGRPKSKGTLEFNLDDILAPTVQVNSSSGVQTLDAREVELLQQVEKAIKGDLRAAKYLLDLFKRHDAIVPPRSEIKHGVIRIPANYERFPKRR